MLRVFGNRNCEEYLDLRGIKREEVRESYQIRILRQILSG
jgi:hypothetical protein